MTQEPAASAKKHKSGCHGDKAPKKPWSRRWMFSFGALAGVFAAMYFANDRFINLGDMGPMADFWDDISTHLPAGVLREAQRLSERRENAKTSDSFSVGRKLQKQGLKLEYPTIIIPGVISTGLESWATEGCSAPYYRKRLWGSWSMLRAMLVDKTCWSAAIALDPITGLDPEAGAFKLRPAQGFFATDYFITGYAVTLFISNEQVLDLEQNFREPLCHRR